MDLTEINQRIRFLHEENDIGKINEKIDLCFEAMKIFCGISKQNLTDDDFIICCYAATILSGIIQKGLGEKVKKFLKEFEIFLPNQAKTILCANLMRMETY